jgi:GrpB-like predicted nucleotidyltransferase (UPF0157 family)
MTSIIYKDLDQITVKKINRIDILPYDPNWSDIFEKEAMFIKQALSHNCLAIHHIGSTSVPGLAAKPKIDMIAVVKNGHLSVSCLEKEGFTYKGEWNIPFKFGFTKRQGNHINLHVFEEGHPDIELNVLFRDLLRNNYHIRDDYERLKRSILNDETAHDKQHPFLKNYTLRKDEFIRSHLKQSDFNRSRFVLCAHTAEWAAVKYFRDTYFFSHYDTDDPYAWTFNHKDHAHLILYQGMEIIGYAHVHFFPNQRSVIRMMLIHQDQQNQNFGSRFLVLIEIWLQRLGIKNIQVTSRPSSLRFYVKNGYANMPFDDPDPYEFDLDGVPVGKVLHEESNSNLASHRSSCPYQQFMCKIC